MRPAKEGPYGYEWMDGCMPILLPMLALPCMATPFMIGKGLRASLPST